MIQINLGESLRVLIFKAICKVKRQQLILLRAWIPIDQPQYCVLKLKHPRALHELGDPPTPRLLLYSLTVPNPLL